MCAMRTTMSSTGQCSYRSGRTFGGAASGLARLECAEGFCAAPTGAAPEPPPGPCEFLLLEGEAAWGWDSTRCFGAAGTGLEGFDGGGAETGAEGEEAAAAGRSLGKAIAVVEGATGGDGCCSVSAGGTRGSNAPVA